MDRELIKLIEDNGLTLHGDIEFFAHLVAEREREECARIADDKPTFTRYAEEVLEDVAELIRARGGVAWSS